MARIIAIVTLALLLLVGSLAVSASLENGGQLTTIENESWTADPGNTTDLNRSNLDGVYYAEQAEVTQNGEPLTAGIDYEWDDSNGTITALDGGTLSGGDTATVTYEYRTPSEEQENLATLFATGFDIGSGLLLALVAGLVITALAVLGRA